MEGTAAQAKSPLGGVGIFFAVLAALALLRIALGYVSLPVAMLPAVNFVVAALFLGLPILALFAAASAGWDVKMGLIYLVGGVAIQLGATVLDGAMAGGRGPLSGVLVAIAQMGLPMWCAGLGALVSQLIREKNIIPPICIFLAFLDAFLVFSPVGITQQVLQTAPQIFTTIAGQVPLVTAEPVTGRAAPGAYIGPADFVFLAAFFVALFRLKMRTDETFRWMVPTLIAYLAMVLVFGFPLPALIPIGLVVLLVNLPEFKLTRDEVLGTILVGALGAGLFIWGMLQPPPPPRPVPTETPRKSVPTAPLPEENVPTPSESALTPGTP